MAERVWWPNGDDELLTCHLRSSAAYYDRHGNHGKLLREAADEIERLREALHYVEPVQVLVSESSGVLTEPLLQALANLDFAARGALNG